MPVRTVSPDEAHALMIEGYVYVDVRSVEEFEEAHPEGAYNVPIMHLGAAGMLPNADFSRVMELNFAKHTRMIVGCKSGGRSARAAELLAARGIEHVVDCSAGFSGLRNPFGVVTLAGWQSKGLPIAYNAVEGREYSALAHAGAAP